MVHQTEQLDQLDAVCEELTQRNVDLIAICGGDGTNHLVCTGLVHAYQKAARPIPPIHLLRGGSMNTIARNNSIDGPAQQALANLVAKNESGEAFSTVRQSLIKINQGYGFFFGNGYATNFLEEYYNSSLESGPGRAAQITFAAIASILSNGQMLKRLSRKFEAEVLIDGKPAGLDSYGMIMASFIEAIGIGFRPLYRAREEQERFHLLVSGLRPLEFVKQVHRFYGGKRIVGQDHIDCLASELVIRSETPLWFTIDGELYQEKRIVISTGPTLDLIVA